MTEEQLAAEIEKIIEAVKTMNSTNISAEAQSKLSELTGKLPSASRIMTLNFTEHFTFAFPVRISVQLDKSVYSAGTYYLYFFNAESKQLEACGTVIVDENGMATFTLSHCSDYFISSVELSENGIDVVIPDDDSAASENPQTGGTLANVSVLLICASVITTAVLVGRLKKRKTEKS